MACKSCAEHRKAIKEAAQKGDASLTVVETIKATKALVENAGRRLIPKKKTPQT